MNRIDELFAEVWRCPEDVELRIVLGDALLEAGDPRGELIQLQQRPHAEPVRLMRLLQQHGLTWLGSLRGAVLPMSYQLGFLASCVAIDEDAGGRVEWATVHTVELGVESVDFLFDPIMRALRCVSGVQEGHLEQLRRANRYPRELELALSSQRLAALYAHFDRIPDLHAIGLRHLRLSRSERGGLDSLDACYDPELQRLLEALPPHCLAHLRVYDVPPYACRRLEDAARAAHHDLVSVQIIAAQSDEPPEQAMAPAQGRARGRRRRRARLRS